MRKQHLLHAVLLVIVIAFSAISCKKEQTKLDTTQGEATLARIMNFKQKVDYYKANPAIKDGESVTIDEAIWNIEALFNLTYAYPELSYGKTVTADTVLYLPLQSDNTVLLTDLTVFYGRMYEVISDIYHGTDLDNKQFLILDVEDDVPSGGSLPIQLHSVQGTVKGTPPPVPDPIMWVPFASDISWKYGENGGNSQNMFYGELDAADTLSGMLNAILVQKPPINYDYYYTETIMKETQINEPYAFPQTIFPNIMPRYCEFYKENPTEDDKWLDADRMNYHYFAEKYLVLEELPNTDVPSNHVLFKVVVDDYKIYAPYAIGHLTTACYGHRNIIGHQTIIKENL